MFEGRTYTQNSGYKGWGTFLNEASAKLSAAQERILFLENRLAESKPAQVDEIELN